MKNSQPNLSQAIVAKYLIITFGLAGLLSLLTGLTGGSESTFIGLGLTAMLFPGVAVLVMKYGYHENPQQSGWNKFPIKWLPITLFIFPITIHVICIPTLYILSGYNIPWDLESRGWEALPPFGLFWRILLNAVVGLLSVTVFAYFEEMGWRVWMLPRLIEKYNVKSGVLIGAAIWALWHIPFVLGEIHYIEGTSKIWLILLNPLGHLGAGIVISWLWLRTQSIWIVCLAHGSLNNWGQYAFKYIQDGDDPGSIPWLLVGLNVSLLVLGLIVFQTILTNHEIQITQSQQP